MINNQQKGHSPEQVPAMRLTGGGRSIASRTDLNCPICGLRGTAIWQENGRHLGYAHSLIRSLVSVSRGFAIDLKNAALAEPPIRCVHCDYVVSM